MPIGEILNPWDAFLYPRRTVAHRYYIVGLGKTNIRKASQTQAFTLFRWPRALQLVHPAANTSLELSSAFHGVLVVTMKVAGCIGIGLDS